MNDVERYALDQVNCILVGTKIDLSDRIAVDTATGLDQANQLEIPFAECSSKDNVGVDDVFELITGVILGRVTATKK